MGKLSPRLTKEEIASSLPDGSEAGAVLKTWQLAELLGLSRKTIDEWVAHGRLDGTFRKRGKHRFFLRDRVLDRVFNGPEWKSHHR